MPAVFPLTTTCGGSAVPRQVRVSYPAWRAFRQCLAGEGPVQPELNTRARRNHDVPVLGLDGALGAEGAADVAANDCGLGAATDQLTRQRADRGPGTDLG